MVAKRPYSTATLLAAAMAVPAMAQIQGPSTSRTPYVVPAAPGVQTKSIFTVGTLDKDGPDGDALPDVVTLDTVNLKPDGVTPYVMVGIADGLGAYDNGDGTFTLLSNQELPDTSGVVRAHGGIGSFVSKWNIDAATLQVNHGEDLIQTVQVWNPVTSSYVNSPAEAFNRFCSADLPAVSAFSYNGLGTAERIFMNGEETTGGRAFGHLATGANAGTSYELPRLGKFAFENSLASPFGQDLTIVIGMDDSDRGFTSEGAGDPSEVFMYVGTKTNSGNEFERAGLTNGNLYGMKVSGAADENSFASGAAFGFHNFGNVENDSAATLETNAIANTITQFRRIEDGAWDPAKPNDFYYVTTDNFSGNSKLFRMSFNDITNPTAGGQIDVLLDGTEGQKMMDNMTAVVGVDGKTRLLMQEDVGNNVHNGKIWLYDPETDDLTLVAKHDPARFGDGSAAVAPFDRSGASTGRSDEESSGIIPVFDILGPGWFLLDVQAHYNGTEADTGLTAEMVQGGQYVAMYVPQAIPEPTSVALLGLGSMLLGRRRRA